MPLPLEPSTIEAARAAVTRCEHVAAAWIFGSLARGDANEGSDLDIAVLLDHVGDATAQEHASLATLASELQKYSPAGVVDVVVLGRAGPILHHRVVREGILVLDRDPGRRIDFVTRAIIEYLDWEPTHRIGMEAALEGLAARLARSAA